MKLSPANKIYVNAVFSCFRLTTVLWIVVGIINKWDVKLIITMTLSSFITEVLVFIPYLLYNVPTLSKNKMLAFVPFAIVLILLVWQLYNLSTGRWAEMVVVKNTIIKTWQARIIETLIVFSISLKTYKGLDAKAAK